MRRTKASLIYRRTKNLRAVQKLLGHTKLKSAVHYLDIEVDDALEKAGERPLAGHQRPSVYFLMRLLERPLSCGQRTETYGNDARLAFHAMSNRRTGWKTCPYRQGLLAILPFRQNCHLRNVRGDTSVAASLVRALQVMEGGDARGLGRV